jgi:hypothetical protein
VTPQDIGDDRQTPLIIVETLCISHREFGDLSFRLATADLEELSIFQWQEVGYGPLNNAQPVGSKIKVANDFRVQQRDGVGCD